MKNSFNLLKVILHISIMCFGIVIITQCQTRKPETHENNSNHLSNETSPYLLQHVHNPVDWYPWKDETLKLAKAQRKLMILSIGYSSCHWCHVMERESFSDTSVSNFMNTHFTSIKVDREERPDVDQVYMTACQIANQNGTCGWPLNVLAMSDGRPFWVGSYMPKEQWLNLLKEFIALYNEDPNELEKLANNIHNNIAVDYSRFSNTKDTTFSEKLLNRAYSTIAQTQDPVYGGRKGSLKFPLPVLYRSLLENISLYNNKNLEKYLFTSLDQMMNGGITDQLEGGFSRYSTDAYWRVPHFEKMLYDNAQLISLYAQSYQYSKNQKYKQVVDKSISFVVNNLHNPENYFYSSLDAESDGEEGKYYALSEIEIRSVLKDENELSVFLKTFNISPIGNWEKGNNILYKTMSDEALSKSLNLSQEKFNTLLSGASEKILEYKKLRRKPALDDKMLTSWNAMMIRALADASIACDNKEYLSLAIKAGDFLKTKMIQPDHSILRTYKNGKASVNGFLEDYVFAMDAFIRLYELTFDESYLNLSKDLCDYVIAHFSSKDNLFFYFNSIKDQQLITRNIDFEDQVTPSANSVMADVLHRLGLYYYNNEYIDRSRRMVVNVIDHFAGRATEYYSNWIRLYGSFVKPPYEVAIVGLKSNELRNQLAKNYLPQAILLGGNTEGNLELLKDKLQEGNTLIYVCRNKTCKLPTSEVNKAIELMK
ncbi:MAG: thioredoxin domain-containing protein [Saprospiraceae bacterium]